MLVAMETQQIPKGILDYLESVRKMGTYCLYSCKPPSGSDYEILRQNQSLKQSQSQHNTTLGKNYHLATKCSHINRFGRLKESTKTADKAITYNFTLSSNKEEHPKVQVQSVKQEQKEEEEDDDKQNLDSVDVDGVIETQEPGAKTFKKPSSFGDRQPLRSNSMKVRQETQSRKPLVFQRKNFLRIAKKNIKQLFEFKMKLGQGAQGSVYKAIDKASQQCRAIKVLHKDCIRYEHDFFAEFETLRILDHPNIVKLYEIIEHNNHYYLVTEYCEGGQVVNQLKKINRFSEATVATIMREIMAAVVYMHQNNVIHRDMKLENIVFQRAMQTEGDRPPIKIIDFGTSKFMRKNMGETLQAPAGTPLYMAPEVLDNRYNNKCDVWSCGVIMYILLSGKPPFRGRTKKQVYSKIQFSPVTFSDPIWHCVSNQAKHLIHKMLQKNSQWRMSALEVLGCNWIRNCANTQPIAIEVLRDMEKFYFRDKFLAIVLTYVASCTISQERRRALANVFMGIDKNNSGSIDVRELHEAYKEVYQETDEAVVESIFKNIDTDGSGKIDFTEFLVVAEKQETLLQRESLLKAFEFFDIDKTGFLDLKEVKQMLGERDDAEAIKIMNEFDTNRDRLISKEEFILKIRELVG